MDAGIADAINRRDVTLICARLDALDLTQYSDKRNTCPCVHCAPYLDAKHGNGCGGYHCKGTCIGYVRSVPWWKAPIADTLMSEADATRGDRAWLIGALSGNMSGIAFDGEPAGGDWDNLFAHFRDAISARRDPESPFAGSGATHPADGVGSR